MARRAAITILAGLLLGAHSTAPAAFTVRDVHSTVGITSLAAADALLAGSGVLSEATATRAFIDMFDADANTGEGMGHYANNQSFPNNVVGVADYNFAIRATATISIATAGIYTFGVNSDDGSRLRVDNGSGFVTVINDNAVHAPSDSFGTVSFAAPGQYSLDFVYFQREGEATVELFAASGSFTSFSPTAFRLVGDTANGGIATVGPAAVPEPASAVMLTTGVLGAIGLGRHRRNSARA